MEIQTRVTARQTAFAKHRDIFKGSNETCFKRQVYNSYVLPAMTYGAETWEHTNRAKNKLAAAQTQIERSMLHTTYRDRKTNIRERENTKVTVRRRNWTWAREGTPAVYEITDGHSVSPLGSPMKGKDLEEDRRYDRETN